MTANIVDIINRAESLRKETALGSITPDRVGAIMTDILKYMNEAQVFADSLVHKIYPDNAAFMADTTHLSDLTGKPMKAGQLIYISDEQAYYRYDGDSNKTFIVQYTAPYYIPDFTIADILQVLATGTPLNVDYGSLMTTVHRRLPIFVKEFPNYPGINSCSSLYEGLLYLRIMTINSIITIDIPSDGIIGKDNISVADLVGNGVIATTPSGDPMHYMFEAAGATWNKDTQLWALDEIDDLTTDEVRLMYSKWNKALFPFAYNDKDKIRTIFPFVGYSSNGATNIFCNPNIEIIPPATGNNIIAGGIASWFYNCQNLRKIKVVLDNNDFNSANFAACYKLEEVRIERLKKSVSFKDSPLLSNESILYMFEKSNAVNPIAITLHPQAYERAMADPAIIAATEAYPDIELGTTE